MQKINLKNLNLDRLPFYVKNLAPKWFPQLNYNNPIGDKSKLLNICHPENIVGHQQRIFNVYWGYVCCRDSGEIGLDVGSAGVPAPWCIGIDKYMGTEPLYNGYCNSMLKHAGEDLSDFGSEQFSLVLANHSVEHMSGSILDIIGNHWLRVLKPSGTLAMIIPNADTMAKSLLLDGDHKHAWSADNFQKDIIEPLLDKVIVREFNTLGNNFSYNCVLRKKDTKRLHISAGGNENIEGFVNCLWNWEDNQIDYDDQTFIECRIYNPGDWILRPDRVEFNQLLDEMNRILYPGGEIKIIFTNPNNPDNTWVEVKFNNAKNSGLIKDTNISVNFETGCKELSAKKVA